MSQTPVIKGFANFVSAKSWLQSVGMLNISEIQREAQRSFEIALVGSAINNVLVLRRLASETPSPVHDDIDVPEICSFASLHENFDTIPRGAITIHTDEIVDDESAFSAAIARIVLAFPKLKVALARRIPAFRSAVASQLIQETAVRNAKLALVSSLPSVIPTTVLLLPAMVFGDIIFLTRNQVVLLLRIAAVYDRPLILMDRLAELVPVIDGAFGWRAVARELIGFLPVGMGIPIKSTIAYAGTYSTGRAAAIFYSTGRTLSRSRLKQLYRDSLVQARSTAKYLVLGGGTASSHAEANCAFENVGFASDTTTLYGPENVEFEVSVDKLANSRV